MNNVNIANILGKAPKDMEVKLYSPMVGDCTLERIEGNGQVWVKDKDGMNFSFFNNGTYFKHKGECLLFPSTDKTWDNWQKKIFEKGCFVVDDRNCVTYLYDGNDSFRDNEAALFRCQSEGELENFRFATGNEISTFLNRLLDNGFRYNVSEKKIEERMVKATETIRFNVKDGTTHEHNLTKKQYDIVKAVIEVITNRK